MEHTLPRFFRNTLRLCIFLIALLAFSALNGQQDLYAQGGPTLVIGAPAKVDVGQPIQITLKIRNGVNIAGYEMNIRYDSNAAHFNGLHQRNDDLKKLGRDLVPLQIEQPSGGLAIGVASCNVADCIRGSGAKQSNGASGNFALATVLIGTDKAGPLEIRFDSAKFVDAAGNPVAVALSTQKITVQVGQGGKARGAAPSTWQLAQSPGHVANSAALDRTHDKKVSHADVMELALGWTDARTAGSPCANLPDPGLDLNGDGCIDVSDVQIAAATAGPVAATSSAQATTAALTFTVNTTNDAADATPGNGICDATGGCTLRAAIDESNAHPGPDNIVFNIPGGGVQTINLKTNLPTLSDATGATTIDGYTQPGASPNTDALASNAQIMIQLFGQGPLAFDGFRISTPGNSIRGLALYNLRRSFYIYGSGATNNTIIGNFIGTDAAAQFQASTSEVNANGVDLESGAAGNHVGTPALADRNVISGNSRHGIATYFEATDSNVFQNNIIGLSPLGDRRLENLKHGIDINSASSSNIIGGTGANERNIIAGDGDPIDNDYSAGVEISHDTSTVQNKILGNCFGTDLSCNSAPAYAHLSHYGIRMEDGVNNNEAAFNVIGNTLQGGIQIDNYFTTFNKVHDNRIGLSANGTSIPNAFFGVRVKYHGQHNTIGPNNIIANNPTGVIIEYNDEDFNTVTANSIYGNTFFGLDLGPSFGVSFNDAGDADTGANEGLNYPVLTGATPTQVSGTACGDAVVQKPCTIEIFKAQRDTGNNGGGDYGEGKTLIGSGSTNGSFSITVSGVQIGDWVTATATDAQGNTSEFSKNFQVAASQGPTPTPTSPPPPTPTPTATAPTTYAQDSFSRTLNNGWGIANIGGPYSLSGTPANFDINGSEGTIRVNAGDVTRSAYLLNVSALDVNQAVRVKADKLPVAGAYIAYLIARHVDTNSHYLGRIRFTPASGMLLQAVAEVNGVQTLLGGEKPVSGVTQAPNAYIWLRSRVTGTNPTTIKLKAWADGQPEPAGWTYTITDSTAALQAAGSVGVRTYVGPKVTNVPIIFSFDDFNSSAP